MLWKTFATAAMFALPLLAAAPAHAAGLDACGNIDVDAHATCEVKVTDCDVSCEPVHVEAACAAKLEVMCEGSCPKVPSVDCTGSCQGSCEADCNVKPATFDCKATCKADATAKCDSQCSAQTGDTKAQCTASCKASFSAQCDASCTGMPGSADCTAKCQGRCQGSCSAQTELMCQVSCQSGGYVDCEATVQGGCKVACSDPKGALFCDGSYVDHNGALQDCIDALKSELDINVDVSATGSSSCSGSSCMAEGQASASCAFSPRGTKGPNGTDLAGAFAIFAALGAVATRRRKSR